LRLNYSALRLRRKKKLELIHSNSYTCTVIELNPYEPMMMHGPTHRALYQKYLAGTLNTDIVRMAGGSPFVSKFQNARTSGYLLHIPIVGMMTRYGQACAIGSEDIVNMIADANNTPEIKGMILEGDGPGGQASGTRELYMAAKNSKKPVDGYIKGMAASAHYYVMAGCRTIYAESNTSQIGSLGALAILEQEKDEKKSYEVLRARGSEKKMLLNSVEPITDDIRTGIIDNLSMLRDLFIADVLATRPALTAAAQTGEVFNAKQAKKEGLIDGIMDKETYLKFITKNI
jgi:protease IV